MDKSRAWRVVVPVVFGAAGFLFATSYGASDGADLRPQDPTSLSGLVRQQRDQVSDLRAQATRLERDIDALSARVQDTQLNRLEEQAHQLSGPAGYTPVSGPGLRIVLDDAPADQPIPEPLTVNDIVVHEQDLQEVVQAMWRAGAEAISLQGQRIVSMTGIKCVGNTVVLQGVPYSPPYRFAVVGSPADLLQGIEASEYLQQEYIPYSRPPVNLTWEVTADPFLRVPAFSGAIDISQAEVLTEED